MKHLLSVISIISIFTACLPIGDQGKRRIRQTSCVTENDTCSITVGAGYFCLNNYCAQCDDSGDHDCTSSDKPICYQNYCVECTTTEDELCSSEEVCIKNKCVSKTSSCGNCGSLYCLNGQCVQCTGEAGQCPPGKECNYLFFCSDLSACNPTCASPKPYCFNNNCVQCSPNPADKCPDGYSCTPDNTCVEGVAPLNTLSTICSTQGQNKTCKYQGDSASTPFDCKCWFPHQGSYSWVIPGTKSCSTTLGVSSNNYSCEYEYECISGSCQLTTYKLNSACTYSGNNKTKCYYDGSPASYNYNCNCFADVWRIPLYGVCDITKLTPNVCEGTSTCKQGTYVSQCLN